jgi:hypothetical protein
MEKLPNFATKALLVFARQVMTNPASQILGEESNPYLYRWWLTKSRDDSVYIHKMMRSDQDVELHDHPGDNLSILLHGEMKEETPHGLRLWQPGSIIARKAEDRHRIVIEEPIITMWIMGPRTRDWGFWTENNEFILSQDFFRERGYF